MGLFDWFRRRRPTPEQEAPLARITNPQQRAALLKAVADGEVIPEYAWDPLPTKFDTFAILPRAGSCEQQPACRGSCSLHGHETHGHGT